MAISPINVTRVSHNMRADYVVNSLRSTQVDLFNAETRIATGRRIVSPSDDPIGATRVLGLKQAAEQQQQFMSNLQYGDYTLAAADSALAEVNSLLIEAATIASQNVSNLTDASERESVADLIRGIRLQLQTVGNREFNGRYLFAGRETLQAPFVTALAGIAYTGDTGDLIIRVGEKLTDAINVPGNLLFGALSSHVGSNADLSPTLTDSTRLETLRGPTGQGVQLGTLVFNEADGAGVFSVDLNSADTVGDVVEAINAAATAAGSDLVASRSDDGIVITPGRESVSITDKSTGVVASSLGILTTEPTADPIEGASLGARLTRLTPVEALAGGAGIDLENGFIITNGSDPVTVDLSQAETLQDIINTINNTGLYVRARINQAGTGLELVNQVSGGSLAIGENEGTTATDLGIRTFGPDTPLESLNYGRGVFTMEGKDDLRVTAMDGTTVDVNLDGAATVGDVITAINAAAEEAGVKIEASLAELGNGIRITDETGGSDPLSVSSLNLSEAAANLGLAQTVTDDSKELVGEDRNPTRAEGIFTALVDLEKALRTDDTYGISDAAARIDPLAKEVIRIHGILGARSQAMQAKVRQTQEAANTTQIFLSEIQDLDYAEAVTRLQSAVTQFQANLQASSVLLNLSLMDFLR